MNFKQKKREEQRKIFLAIKNFLGIYDNWDYILSIIERNTSKKNKDFFPKEEFLSLFEKENSFEEIKSILFSWREKVLIIDTLKKYQFPGYTPEAIFILKQKKTAVEVLRYSFADFTDLEEILSLLRKKESIWNLKGKKAEKLYSSALNIVNKKRRLEKLEEALAVSPWGSVISLRIIKEIILEEIGISQKGKNFTSLRKEVKKNKK